MTNKRDAKSAKALDDLDRSREAGAISAGQYDVQRAKLLAEASERPMNPGVAILVIAGVLVVLLVAVRLFFAAIRQP